MTTQLDHRPKPAHVTTPTGPTSFDTDRGAFDTDRGEGVKAVALFESRRGRSARAWDELSEIDRQVLLEAVRQRREYQAYKTKIYSELYGMRINK